MLELGVVGAKKSGKTTVIEGLVGYLAVRGYRVATIKHTSHSHRFDTPGKDSYRHRQAGAGLTVAVSDEDFAVFTQPGMLDIRQVQDLIRHRVDVWIVEGDRRSDRPKVLVTRNLKETQDTLPGNIVATIGPERVDGVTAHFEDGDHQGLGSFVISEWLGKPLEARE